MTWFGKILAFMVLVLALCWVWLTATVFVTRGNWKKNADDYKTALDQVRDTRAKEYEDSQAKIAELSKQLDAERSASTASANQVSAWRVVVETNVRDYGTLTKSINDGDTKSIVLQAVVDSSMKEVEAVRRRSNSLEDDRKDLTIALAKAMNDRAQALSEASQARGQNEDLTRRVEALNNQVAELKAAGGGGMFGGPVERSFTRGGPPTLEGTRGTVTAYQDGLLVISLGYDAGVGPGTVLDVSRYEGGGKFIGTVTVTDAYPKSAVARFNPPYGKPPLARMAADDLPKAGDKVTKPTR